MEDEGLHEIRLDGKQLVFLFMAATVVSVVIFLCGVMVGRGVRVPGVEPLAAASGIPEDPTLASAADLRDERGPSVVAGEDVTYPGLLTANTVTPPETLAESVTPAIAPPPAVVPEAATAAKAAKVVAPSTPSAPAKAATPRPGAAARRAPTAATASASAVPADRPGAGFTVQVAAVRQRREADVIARRLTAKGYPVYVTPSGGTPAMFRVRVGKYPNRNEARSVANRLEKEEQFKPWITR